MVLEIDLQPILQNNLVKLVPLKEDDFESLYKIASDPLIWAQHPTPDRYKKDIFKLYFDGAVKSKSAFLIIDQATNELIGSTRFYDLDATNYCIAIGYTFITRKYWGGQYNKSIKELLLNYIFQFVEKVVFHVGLSNFRSQKAVLKLGAVKTREIEFEYYGKKTPNFEFEIKKKDWNAKWRDN